MAAIALLGCRVPPANQIPTAPPAGTATSDGALQQSGAPGQIASSTSCAESATGTANETDTQPTDSAPKAPSAEELAYAKALDLAKNPTPERIYDQLTAIVPDNPRLAWKDIDGHPHVRVASWVSTFKYYQDSVGKPYNTGKYDIWVTAAPFVQELCRDPEFRGADVDARLVQLLGLPPGTSKQGFMSAWVRADDLFRPCPDNEVTDTVCGLALPNDVEPWYRAWFNDLRAKQYFVAKDPEWPGWPWTQLGYTFDWHDLERPIGVSEFVIKNNATIQIEALTPPAEYCAPSAQP